MQNLARALVAVSLVALAGAALAQAPTPPPVDTRSFPGSPRIEGKSNETRAPEKADDKPAFAGQTRAPFKASTPIKTAVITDKLFRPWGFEILPSGKFLVTEKPGAFRIVGADGSISSPMSSQNVVFSGQGGLLDVALDRQYATNHRIFFTFTEMRGTGSAISVGSAILDEATATLKDLKTIYKVAEAAPLNQTAQQGSRIAVAADNTLFVSIGDRSTGEPWLKAQDMGSALGKIIHITADGAPAADNPKLPGWLPEIWAAGFRTPQGLTFDASGQLWEVEHGPRGGDELNKIVKGKNYGWPVIVHGINYSGTKVGEGISVKEGMEQSQYYWDPVIAPSSVLFYDGNLFPQWKGNVLVGALRGQQISRLSMNGDKVTTEEPLQLEPQGRIRDVKVGPDGAIYALNESNSLLKITPR